jgi:hypothetical protein
MAAPKPKPESTGAVVGGSPGVECDPAVGTTTAGVR